jgi:predicted anti-sigma-YlaC factor YlaD
MGQLNQSKSCSAVQEAIAWNRTPHETLRNHLLDCESCRAFGEQIAQLDARMNERFEIEVPVGFADRVMARLQDPVPTVAPRGGAARLLEAKSFQLVATQVALLVSLSNLVRFVLSLLVPNTAWGGY